MKPSMMPRSMSVAAGEILPTLDPDAWGGELAENEFLSAVREHREFVAERKKVEFEIRESRRQQRARRQEQADRRAHIRVGISAKA